MALGYISRRANRLKISSTSIFEKLGRKITRFENNFRTVGRFNLTMGDMAPFGRKTVRISQVWSSVVKDNHEEPYEEEIQSMTTIDYF